MPIDPDERDERGFHPYGARTRPDDDEWRFIGDDTVIVIEGAARSMAEYSMSYPTGLYMGKVWKCQMGTSTSPHWWMLEVIPDPEGRDGYA